MEINFTCDNKITNEYKSNMKALEKFKVSKGLSYKEITSLINYTKKLEKILSRNFPNIKLNIRSVKEKDINDFYENRLKENIQGKYENSITISPLVLDKMNKDKEYALKIISAIIKCGCPKSFEDFQLQLYEYNIFVRDDGKVETVYCTDIRKKIEKLRKAKAVRKASIKKRIAFVKTLAYSRYLYENRKLSLLNVQNVKRSYIPYEYYLCQSSELKRLIFSLYE